MEEQDRENEQGSPSDSPSFGQLLGLAYKTWTLDCVITIAHAVSLDFSDRPELYQHIGNDTAATLTELQGDYGFQAAFPSTEIRQRLMKPVFGGSDGHGSGLDDSAFQMYRMPVLAAAAGFAENAQPTAFPMLRERVRSAIVPFKTHMVDLQGSSFAQTERRREGLFNVAQSILKDQDVVAVFGINSHIDPWWPLESTDPQGAKLIEQITTQLHTMLPFGVISREQFVHMQRIGEKGRQAIRIIVDSAVDDPNTDLDPLITQLYAWGSDLGLIGGPRPQGRPPMAQPPAPVAAGTGNGMGGPTALGSPVLATPAPAAPAYPTPALGTPAMGTTARGTLATATR